MNFRFYTCRTFLIISIHAFVFSLQSEAKKYSLTEESFELNILKQKGLPVSSVILTLSYEFNGISFGVSSLFKR